MKIIWYNPRVIWRGARVVERGGLENRCPCEGTVGSNPTLSAIDHHSTTESKFKNPTAQGSEQKARSHLPGIKARLPRSSACRRREQGTDRNGTGPWP